MDNLCNFKNHQILTFVLEPKKVNDDIYILCMPYKLHRRYVFLKISIFWILLYYKISNFVFSFQTHYIY